MRLESHLRWLPLNRSPLSGSRRKKNPNDTTMPTKPPVKLRRDRAQTQDDPELSPPLSEKLRQAIEYNEQAQGHRRTDTGPTTVGTYVGKQSVDSDGHARHFTVVNVGAGGTLYLKPSRMGASNFLSYAPATPPGTADGSFSVNTERLLLRDSDASIRTWKPRLDRSKSTGGVAVVGVSYPPVSLANPHNRRRTRSHSCSTVSDVLRHSQRDSEDYQGSRNGERTPRRRRRSSTDMSRGLVNVSIPHYRLGTPHFSDRGTAFLHYSTYTNSTESRVPSSVLSRAEYDKLFPVPPGRGASFYGHLSGASAFLHSTSFYSNTSTISRTPHPSSRPSTIGKINPALFGKLESDLDDAAVVHYHPTSGRIVAATPARLIAQITSPQFLDYELLADYFLTFRCFMPTRDVLHYLLARMRWAFESGSDAGRIARVRTFVALRHWILNYFQDDFIPDGYFRQDFCDSVNDLAISLRQRPDQGGGDMNIVGELKKCWRRTCAMYWPTQDAHESSPDAEIVPGGEQREQSPPAPSEFSLPLTIRPTTRSQSIFEVTQIPMPERPDPRAGLSNGHALETTGPSARSTFNTTRTASIPASPMSELSLEVLSCSVPFLRNMRPITRGRRKPTPPQTEPPPPPLSKPLKAMRPTKTHKRSGSFSDALRDKRTPLSSPKMDNIELKDLPAFAITGGLVRGILLQPSPAQVDNLVPVTPGQEMNDERYGLANEGYFGHTHAHNLGVRKLVGGVRRALSSRKVGGESPARRDHSASSTESTSRGRSRGEDRKPKTDYQQLPGAVRLDILGLRIENSYRTAVEATQNEKSEPLPGPDSPVTPTQEKPLPESRRAETPRPSTALKDQPTPIIERQQTDVMDFGRLNSHVTTGSRSIVIVDATRAPGLPPMSAELMPTPLFRGRDDLHRSQSRPGSKTRWPSEPPLTRDSYLNGGWRSSDARMHALLTAPDRWSANDEYHLGHGTLRKSSGVEPAAFEIPSVPHELRRRPGGDDLRTAENVQELAPGPRPYSAGTISTRVSTRLSRAFTTSIMDSAGDLNGGVLLRRSQVERNSSVSLLRTHSSQPVLRPSFESEARRLKGLPDFDSTGSIEDALLKLEGKIPSPANSTLSVHEGVSPLLEDNSKSGLLEPQEFPADFEPPEELMGPPLEPPPPLRELHSGEIKVAYDSNRLRTTPSPLGVGSPTVTDTQAASVYHLSESPGMQSMSSQTEYPLLDTLPPQGPATIASSAASVAPMVSRLSRFPINEPYMPIATPESFTYIQKPESSESVAKGGYPSFQPGPWDPNSQASFLLDDNETLSDISTEIADGHSETMPMHSFYFDEEGDDHPYQDRAFQQYITPPSTAGGPADMSPDRRQLLPRLLPRDPERPLKGAIGQPRLQPQTANQPFPRRQLIGNHQLQAPSTKTFPAHMPFVLAFESEVIAEQLTIIEKDALDEVDWKDLISLNWVQSPPYVRNWVDYLNKENANGIDIVIARFNLVVKWCISEIVLTEMPSERARTITKFIHIASHCHRLHNYASLYQITLALLSSDLARLQKSWSLVALRDKQMLEQLEELCRPIRNFHCLRAEMETAMPGNGIIPFIGLYTHDLMFNALKSSRINCPVPQGEPLVNFERYQTAASIVKNLLRLIEASAKYTFRPEPEALSRCLWIAALDDDEITARSKSLEQN